MFVLKQFLKAFLLPPMPWLILLLAVVVFWRRTWARKLLFLAVLLIIGLHSGLINYALRYPLELRYPPLIDPNKVGHFDAIAVLTEPGVCTNSDPNRSLFPAATSIRLLRRKTRIGSRENFCSAGVFLKTTSSARKTPEILSKVLWKVENSSPATVGS